MMNEKRKLNDKIIGWYDRREEFNESSDYLFDIPVIQRCMMTRRNKEAWIRTVELEYEIQLDEIKMNA